ncbi:MAG: hypothetical protein HZB21_05030 [Deltaproteobacteria bacterium]|nr:hypothetical protein [Deltaproteobacteria bacterium]MBI5810535.1 hypothetical protein [Deltaproteobacteria bacterium]
MALTLFITLAVTAYDVTRALADSIEVASEIVLVFHDEAANLTKDLEPNDDVKTYRRLASEQKDDVMLEIDSLNLAERPGQRRFKKIYKAVEMYTNGQIESLTRLTASVKGVDKNRLEDAIKKLTALREEQLLELNDTFKAETFEKEGIKPVPLIDRGPYDKTPDEEPNIWFR